MIELPRAVREIAAIFERLDCKYAIMGGLAARMHGIPRPTYDVDFNVALERPKFAEFFALVREAGYTVPGPYETGWVDQVGGMPIIKVRL